MARLSFDIPDEHVPVLLDAFAEIYNYREEVEDPNEETVVLIPNPESKQWFAKRIIMSFIKNTFTKYNSEIDIKTAREVSLQESFAKADTFKEV